LSNLKKTLSRKNLNADIKQENFLEYEDFKLNRNSRGDSNENKLSSEFRTSQSSLLYASAIEENEMLHNFYEHAIMVTLNQAKSNANFDSTNTSNTTILWKYPRDVQNRIS
jgi:hypothetical protein